MIERDIWHEDRSIEEASKIAGRVVPEFWTRGTAKGYISLYGHNTDEIYAYTIYMSLKNPRGVAGLVRDLIARAPGSVKEIKVYLLSANEKDPFTHLESYRPIQQFEAEVDGVTENVRKKVLERLPAPFKEKVSAGKNLLLEYDIGITYLVDTQESKILLDTFGPLILAEEARALALAEKLGDVKGFLFTAVRDIEIVSVEEEPDSIPVFVIINPSHKE